MADPDLVIRAKGRSIEEIDTKKGTIVRKEGRALDLVAAYLAQTKERNTEQMNEGAAQSQPGVEPPLPPFIGGFAGYVGYEYGGVLERLPAPKRDDLGIPDVVLAHYPWVLAWDHALGLAWSIALDAEAAAFVDELRAKLLGSNTADAGLSTDFSSISNSGLNTDPSLNKPPAPSTPPPSTNLVVSSEVSKTGYETAITRIQEYIRAGDIFQANLSQRFSAPFASDPWTLYRTLCAHNPAPFAAYFETDAAVLVSASPERFLRISASGSVDTRPIKGTRPRGATPDEDEQNSINLLLSEKDAAEHVMIVDVLRNDISRVCEYGTVQVPELKILERYATVYHLVSTVTGQLRHDATAIDCMHACFPGGSITGAPKVRAMEIIAELEPTARNVYCGSICYFSVTGAMDSSIVIRTFTIKGDTAYFSAGGGIVADSNPNDEYHETLDKSRALVEALTKLSATRSS